MNFFDFKHLQSELQEKYISCSFLTRINFYQNHGKNDRNLHKLAYSLSINLQTYMSKNKTDPNPNSPQNFYSEWLFKCSKEFINSWHKNHLMLGDLMLQHTLEFSSRYNKSVEMFDWLNSAEGYKFLKKEFDGGKCLLVAIEELNKLTESNDPDSYDVKHEIIEEYIRGSKWPFDFHLKLVDS